jgi:hypothetical protein
VARANFWVPGNTLDDWTATRMVFGTSREVEAQRSLALQYRDTLADTFTEVLVPLQSDAETSDADSAASDLILIGGPAENSLAARLQAEGKLPIEAGHGWFKWQGRTYGRADDGFVGAFPNPWNPQKMLTLIISNSRLQEWAMTRVIPRGNPGWATYRGGEVKEKGHAEAPGSSLSFQR